MSENFEAKLHQIVTNLDLSYREQGEQDIASIKKIGGNSYQQLISILSNPDIDIDKRQIVCWLLARLGDKRAISTLLEVLTEEDAKLRIAATQSLGELGGKEAFEVLANSLLRDNSVDVRKSAAYALGLIDDDHVVPVLIKVLNNHHEVSEVRGMAAESLATFQDNRAIASLVTALTDTSTEVRFWSAFALGELATIEVIPELERLSITDEAVLPGWGSVSKEASDAIERIKSRDI